MRLFRRFKRTARQSDERSINLAFVLLSTPQLPDADEVIRSFASLTTNGAALRSRESDDPSGMEILLLEVDADSDAMIALMPIPVPNREADEAARFSVSTFGTGWTLPPHEAHLVVTLQSAKPALESLLTFTSVLAAIAEASPAVGIYCGNAGATHDPDFFIDLAREGSVDTGVMLWNGVSLAQEPDGRVSLLSLGMKQLELPDLWLIAPRESEPLEWFFNLLSYVASEGEPIPDGDTIGRTEDEKIPVRYVPSPIDDTTKVARIEIS